MMNAEAKINRTSGKILLVAPSRGQIYDMLSPLVEISDRLTIIENFDQLQDELWYTSTLPVCIVLPILELNHFDLQKMSSSIKKFRQIVQGEVPLLVITSGNAPVPLELRPTAAMSDAVSPDVLIPRIAGLKRLTNRSEEARVRRRLFGSLPDYRRAFFTSKLQRLLISGSGRSFVDLNKQRMLKLEVVKAHTPRLVECYLTQYHFDAVILDKPIWESVDELISIRSDPRYLNIPILAQADTPAEARALYNAGATDVFVGQLSSRTILSHLYSALRAGRRQRLIDTILTVSSKWLSRNNTQGIVSVDIYNSYLSLLEESTSRRGEAVFELELLDLIGRFTGTDQEIMRKNQEAWSGTVLSIALAVCRDEDFVANVEGYGPVAVLRTKKGLDQLSNRIMVMVRTTGLGT
ncbi:PleD family two-component system response regulator [Flexibacterium corallicola]|uniref:DNA-binding response regulator n=1 Tax=Flexibacterium corallicola TaxID=3037259 RepID=UPI00286F7890|nr:DNA-binding response regulator [Pseudovibrio sp. M1P-2-3]